MKKFFLLFVLFIGFSIFAQEHRIGRFLIMGWMFSNSDTILQSNCAVDSLLYYLEAAKHQMYSEERYELSGQIVLYKETISSNTNFTPQFYIYINSRSDTDYLDRCMEFAIFTYDNNNNPVKYTLAIFYNNYDWFLYSAERREYLDIYLNGEEAYEFIFSEVASMKN